MTPFSHCVRSKLRMIVALQFCLEDENNFLEPVFRCVDIRLSLDELKKVCLNDSQKLMIEIKSEVSKNVPKLVAVEENLFI